MKAKLKVEFSLEKIAMFWLRVFGNLEMNKNNKGSIVILIQSLFFSY